jgi:probable blue pigment (indigoidine) exporter
LFLGAYRLPGGVAASVGAVQPVIAAALAAVLIGERFGVVNIVSGALGATGVGLLVLRNEIPLDGLGLFAALAGTVSMASGVVLTRKWGRPVPLLAFTAWQLLAGGVLLVPIALAFEGLPPEITGRNVVGYGWLTLVGTALAYSLWFRGIGKLPVAATSVLGLLTPVMAAIIGWAALDQSLRPIQFLGIAAILGSVAVIQWSSARSGSGAAAAATPPAVLVPVATGR